MQCLKATIENKTNSATTQCAVQQQGGHIEHLILKLQDVTVISDNN